MDEQTGRKLDALARYIADCGTLLVSFSGGVDSGLLAVVAQETLGKKAHCVFIDSPFVPESALRQARDMAKELGLTFEIISIPEFDRSIRENSRERCYYCKKLHVQILKRRAEELGISCIADGMNWSDLSEHRPGLRASMESGIRHPFIDTKITKSEIRSIARERGLGFWDKPSASCMASRIPYGDEITDEKLRMIETAEKILNGLGFSQVRVRCHADVARIEVPGEDMPHLFTIRDMVLSRLRQAGFSYVSLDLQGYRTGSMDELR